MRLIVSPRFLQRNRVGNSAPPVSSCWPSMRTRCPLLAGLTSGRVLPCRAPCAPAQGSRPPSRSAPPWTSSPASACRGDSAWASPRASWVGLLTGGRGQRSEVNERQKQGVGAIGGGEGRGFMEGRAGGRAPYRSHCAAANSGPRGWGTSPSGPAAGSRSSSPGSHWEMRGRERENIY